MLLHPFYLYNLRLFILITLDAIIGTSIFSAIVFLPVALNCFTLENKFKAFIRSLILTFVISSIWFIIFLSALELDNTLPTYFYLTPLNPIQYGSSISINTYQVTPPQG